MSDSSRTLLLVFTSATAGLLISASLSSPPAMGFPQGPNVSYGANPIVSAGGNTAVGSSTTVLSATSGQDIILTDVVLTPTNSAGSCQGYFDVELTSGGNTIAAFSLSTYYTQDAGRPGFSFNSGLRVAEGDSVDISSTWNYQNGSSSGYCGNMSLTWTVSGYLAAP